MFPTPRYAGAAADAPDRREQPPEMNEATIRLHVEKLAGGRFLATSADVPGLVAEGSSIVAAAEIAQGLARRIAESCIEHGDPLPPGLSQLVEPDTAIDLLVPVGVP